MIKNIVFDIGNVILNFDIKSVLDDNLNNIKTAILLDIKGIKVKPDNYQDVEDKLKKNNIKF